MLRLESIRTGGAEGADRAWISEADKVGIPSTVYSFAGHAMPWKREALDARLNIHIVELAQHQLNSKLDILHAANQRLGRNISRLPQSSLNLLLRNAWIAEGASALLAIAQSVDSLGLFVGGGTGWSVEMARVLGIPVFVFSQKSELFYQFDMSICAPAPALEEWPVIVGDVACVGTRKLTSVGMHAIELCMSNAIHQELRS